MLERTVGSADQAATTRLERAIARMRTIVGERHVLTSEEEIIRRSACTIPWSRRCAAVVHPGSTEEVQAIVRVAAEEQAPIWVYSQGKNWGYGTTVAAHDGAIVVILDRMNRIVEVNEELAYAVVEPGVTYRQLHQYLRDRHPALWPDSTDGPPDGSVVGNALDRGIGPTPYADHFRHACGMEVVLGDGSVVYTGGLPPDRSHAWNVHKWGIGPYLEGIFTQSNFGIVTRMGIWLMPAPPAFQSFTFELRDERRLPEMVDGLRRLALRGAIDCAVHALNDFCMVSILTQFSREASSGDTRLSDATLAALRRRYQLPPWSFAAALYGTAAQIRVNRRLIRNALGPYGRLTFLNDRRIRVLRGALRLVKKARAVPSLQPLVDAVLRDVFHKSVEVMETAAPMHAYFKGQPGEYFSRYAYFKSDRARPERDLDPVRDGCGVIWLAPVVPCTGRHVTRMVELARPLFAQHGFDFWVALLLEDGRAMVVLFSIFFRKDDPEETVRASALYDALARATLDAGYPQYRTSVAYMGRLFEDSPDYRRLLASMKAALDPAGILAPGRYGITGSLPHE